MRRVVAASGEGVPADGESLGFLGFMDDELLALELQELSEADFDLSLTVFDPGEIDAVHKRRSIPGVGLKLPRKTDADITLNAPQLPRLRKCLGLIALNETLKVAPDRRT